MEWSNLGLAFEGAPALGPAMRIASSHNSAGDETWNSVAGKANPIRDHYNAVSVQTVETTAAGRRVTIEARAYDDGVAFRYIIPAQPALQELRITNEATQFRFSKDATTWSLILRDFQTSNEDDYHELTITALHPEYLIGLPQLLEVPGVAWVGLTEAYIDDWAGLFVHTGPAENAFNGQYVLNARLAPRVEDRNAPHTPWPMDAKAEATMVSVIRQTPAQSPWRVLMIADDPGRLVESNMVVNLNPPSAIADTSWIVPGKTAWDWWSGQVVKNVPFQGGMNTETMKYYIDFSARNGFPYMLVDAGWAPSAGAAYGAGRRESDLTKFKPQIDIPELVQYAKSKGVKIWLWAYWTDVDAQAADAFAQFEKWGVAGVKIDFMDRADQWMVNWYRDIAQKAAAHHLMVDYHGAYKPDGMRRTYPNVLTREGVMGAEYNKWSARETPVHNTTLPFTRMLAGPMDYTPGGFNNVTKAAVRAAQHRADGDDHALPPTGAVRGVREPVHDGGGPSGGVRRPEGDRVSASRADDVGRDARVERAAGAFHHDRAAQRAVSGTSAASRIGIPARSSFRSASWAAASTRRRSTRMVPTPRNSPRKACWKSAAWMRARC